MSLTPSPVTPPTQSPAPASGSSFEKVILATKPAPHYTSEHQSSLRAKFERRMFPSVTFKVAQKPNVRRGATSWATVYESGPKGAKVPHLLSMFPEGVVYGATLKGDALPVANKPEYCRGDIHGLIVLGPIEGVHLGELFARAIQVEYDDTALCFRNADDPAEIINHADVFLCGKTGMTACFTHPN